MQLCYEARKRLLFVLWDGIVFKDILYQMGRIRDTFIYGAADHGLSGEGNTGDMVLAFCPSSRRLYYQNIDNIQIRVILV